MRNAHQFDARTAFPSGLRAAHTIVPFIRLSDRGEHRTAEPQGRSSTRTNISGVSRFRITDATMHDAAERLTALDSMASHWIRIVGIGVESFGVLVIVVGIAWSTFRFLQRRM